MRKSQREHKAYNYFTKGQALEKGVVDKKVEIYQYYKDKCYDYAKEALRLIK